jgi:hypothetical protein
MDAGHFVPKSAGSLLYFEETNIYPQCPDCNRYGSNDTGYNFGKTLEKEIGDAGIRRLEELKKKTHPLTAQDLIEIKQYYKKKLDKLGCG